MTEENENDNGIDFENLDLRNREDVEKLRDELVNFPDPTSLTMSRVPLKTAEWFKELADEYYASDYGMTLTMLKEREELRDEVHGRIDQIQNRQDQIEQKLDLLLNQIQESGEREKASKTLNG